MYTPHQSQYSPQSYNSTHQTHKTHMPISMARISTKTYRHSYISCVRKRTHPLKFIRLRKPPRRNHTHPFLPPLPRVNVEDIRHDKTGRYAIDATEIDPFDGEAFGHLDEGCFGGVVLSLQSVKPTFTWNKDKVGLEGDGGWTYSSLLLR